MRHAQEDFRVRGLGKWWLHWVHSAWTAHRPNAKYPENLRYEPMPNSNIVYMNGAERQGIASQYGVDPDDIGVVYNPKDFRSFHNFTSLAWDITRKLSIPTKDIVQIFPFCSTRMKAKGIDDVIRTHAAIKRQGKSVALVLANSNSNGMHNFIDMKKAQAKELGLVEGDDFLFTSDITGKEALPRETVANLFLASNVFVFGSWREVCPNVVLEAKISGNLLAINAGLSCAHEFGGDEAIYFSGTAKRPGVPDGGAADRIETATDYDDLARKIIAKAPDQTAKWEYSYERIWNDQFLPLLVHAIRCARESAVEYKSGHGVRGTL
jgi:glycosyltransferase involved in cell wall biosynthesis